MYHIALLVAITVLLLLGHLSYSPKRLALFLKMGEIVNVVVAFAVIVLIVRWATTSTLQSFCRCLIIIQ